MGTPVIALVGYQTKQIHPRTTGPSSCWVGLVLCLQPLEVSNIWKWRFVSRCWVRTADIAKSWFIWSGINLLHWCDTYTYDYQLDWFIWSGDSSRLILSDARPRLCAIQMYAVDWALRLANTLSANGLETIIRGATDSWCHSSPSQELWDFFP